MSTEKTQGLVIRMADFSESSSVVTFFTRDWGKIAVVAKGARRLKGPFEAALDLLTVCNIVFIRKSSSGLDILTEAKLQTRFAPRAGQLLNLYAGYYVAELLAAFSEDYDPHPRLFDQALLALDWFSAENPPQLGVMRFEMVILKEIGQLPELDACVICGNAPASHEHPGFHAGQGGLVCGTCQPRVRAPLAISAGGLGLLRQLADDSEIAWKRLAGSPAQWRELRAVATAAICHALGHRPKMLRYLEQ